MRTFILSALLCLALASPAQARLLTADRINEPQALLPYCSWLMDKDGEFGIGDVSSGPLLERFSPLASLPLKGAGPVWIRLALIKTPPQAGGSIALTPTPRLIVNLGRLPQGRNEIYFSEAPGPVEAASAWHAEAIHSHEDILLPEPGLVAMSVFIRLEEMPDPWFSPLVQAEHATRPDILPAELLLPGLLIAAAIACLLRALSGKAQWALWSAIFLSMGVCQAAFPLPPLAGGIDFFDLPALLAPGLAVLILPHVARCMFRTDQEPSGHDLLLYFCSLLGAGAALAPLAPGYGWLCRLFPLAPLLLFPLLPLCIGALSDKRPGSLAFTGAAVMPILGAGLSLYALLAQAPPSLAGTLASQGGLWGMAVGGLGLAMARMPRGETPSRDTGGDPVESAGLALAGSYADAARVEAKTQGPALDMGRDFMNLRTQTIAKDAFWTPEYAPKAFDVAQLFEEPLPDKTASMKTPPAPESGLPPVEDPPRALYADKPDDEPPFLFFEDLHESPPADAAPPDSPTVGDQSPIQKESQAAFLQFAAPGDSDTSGPSPVLPAFASASDSAALPNIGGNIISLVDEGFSAYSLTLMDELADNPARHITLTPEGGYLFNLHSLVREVHGIVTPIAKAKGLIFSWFIAPSLPVLLEGDAPRLRGALSLLLQNAVQASHRGAVQLAVRHTPGSSEPGDLLFTISDNGSAQRTDAGFFHAWELAAKSGGSFNADYSPGGGTTVSFSVRFSLPSEDATRNHLALAPVSPDLAAELSGEAPDQEQPAWQTPEAPAAPLVVSKAGSAQPVPDPVTASSPWEYDAAALPEDFDRIRNPLSAHISEHHRELLSYSSPTEGSPSPMIPPLQDSLREPRVIAAEMTTSKRKLLTHYLQGLSCELAHARTDSEFLQLAEESGPALYLFDGDMPEQDIIRLMSALRDLTKDSSARRSPVLVLTGHESQSERLRRAGADYTLLKPFQQDELCAIVTTTLPCGLSAGTDAPAATDPAPVPVPDALKEAPQDAQDVDTPVVQPVAESAICSDPEAENHTPKRPQVTVSVARITTSAKRRANGERPAQDNPPCHDSADWPALAPVTETGARLPYAADMPDESPGASAASTWESRTARQDAEICADAAQQVAPFIMSLSAEDVTPVTEPDDEAEKPCPDAPENSETLLDFMLPEESAAPDLPETTAPKEEPADAADAADAGSSSPGAPVFPPANAPATRPAPPADADADGVEIAEPSITAGEKAAPFDTSPYRNLDMPSFADEALAAIEGARAAGLFCEQSPTRQGAQTFKQPGQAEPVSFPLPGIEGESLDASVIPLAPGIVHALGDILKDAEEAYTNNANMLMQDATARLAAKAEHFGLHKLGRIARCVERAAEADDLEAVRTLYEDLAPITRRYIKAIQGCSQSFLHLAH